MINVYTNHVWGKLEYLIYLILQKNEYSDYIKVQKLRESNNELCGVDTKMCESMDKKGPHAKPDKLRGGLCGGLHAFTRRPK